MKPLEQRQQYVDYMTGKQMSANDFARGGLDIFGDYVWPEVLKEHCTRQLDFSGEVWYQKTRPTPIPLTPEQEHLLRPPDTREGRRKAGL